MRLALLAFCLLACWPLYAEIEVTFPEEAKPKSEPGKLTVVDVPGLTPEGPPEAVRIDGLAAYYTGGFQHLGGELPKSESFDKLKEGMTLREIVSLLGPGSVTKFAGGIYWRCEDGRVLQVMPTQQLDEKAKYWIDLHGTDQRHEEVARLAKALISSISTTKLKVEVTCAQDTHQAKAGQVKTYEVGQAFQKVDPLPRLDFTISKIEGDSVHCHYFYQPLQEGLLWYTETGSLILRNPKQAGAGQPATAPESKPEAGQTPKPESEGRSK